MVEIPNEVAEQPCDDTYRYWPDVGPALVAFFMRERMDEFIQRFADAPPHVVMNSLQWVASQLQAIETAKALAEVANLSGAIGENDLRLRQAMEGLLSKGVDHKKNPPDPMRPLGVFRDPLYWRYPDRRCPQF